jgi:hypothetical protein
MQVVEPQKHVFMKAAHNGVAIKRRDSVLKLVEPIAMVCFHAFPRTYL